MAFKSIECDLFEMQIVKAQPKHQTLSFEDEMLVQMKRMQMWNMCPMLFLMVFTKRKLRTETTTTPTTKIAKRIPLKMQMILMPIPLGQCSTIRVNKMCVCARA